MKNAYYVSVDDGVESNFGRVQRLSVRLADSEEDQFTSRARIVQLTYVIGRPAIDLAKAFRKLADELEKS